MGEEVFVECDVTEGMFSDEAVVELADQAFVVPKASVRFASESKRGRVRARLVKNDLGEWIVLPTNYSESIPSKAAVIVSE
jgi:hypothetical protein